MNYTNPKIRFERWFDNPEPCIDADKLFDYSRTVTCNTYQIAIQMCLELLGTRIAAVPVILPVTASPQTVTAVLRSGGHPLLLDVDASTLQLQPNNLKFALESVSGAIVILTRPGGQEINSSLLNIVEEKKVPWIEDTRLLPNLCMFPPQGVFAVYDLSNICTSGGMITSTYSHQIKELRVIRSGLLGHSANLPFLQSKLLKSRLDSIADFRSIQKEVSCRYMLQLHNHGKDGIIVFNESNNWPYFMVKVGDAKKTVAHLDSYNIQAVVGLYPLHHIPELQERWEDTPEYPVAESLVNQIVCLPTNPGVAGHEGFIIEKLLEIL